MVSLLGPPFLWLAARAPPHRIENHPHPNLPPEGRVRVGVVAKGEG